MCAANCDTICETVFISDVTLVYADGLDQAHKRTNMAGRRSGRIYLNEADIEAQLNPGDEENYIYEDIDELNGNEAGWIDDHDELEAIYDAFGTPNFNPTPGPSGQQAPPGPPALPAPPEPPGLIEDDHLDSDDSDSEEGQQDSVARGARGRITKRRKQLKDKLVCNIDATMVEENYAR